MFSKAIQYITAKIEAYINSYTADMYCDNCGKVTKHVDFVCSRCG